MTNKAHLVPDKKWLYHDSTMSAWRLDENRQNAD